VVKGVSVLVWGWWMTSGGFMITGRLNCDNEGSNYYDEVFSNAGLT
jgi:hypothetical protein